jgi:hypothetical protein
MSEVATYYRPSTRKELLDALREGKVCEVPGAHLEMTNAILRGWGNFHAFVIEDSRNDGYAVYKPTTPDLPIVAICPQCGSEELAVRFLSSIRGMSCMRCKHTFK